MNGRALRRRHNLPLHFNVLLRLRNQQVTDMQLFLEAEGAAAG
jgi:hypothetical protein